MGARCCQLLTLKRGRPFVSPYFFDSLPEKIVVAGFQMQTQFES